MKVSWLIVYKVVPEDGGVLRPGRDRRSAHHLEDLGQLVRLVLAGEQRGPPVQLGEDAAAGPDVYRGGVGGAQQDLGCSVPQGHHLTTSHDQQKYSLIKNIYDIKL